MLKVPSTISKIVTLADNTVRLQVDCQELASENEAEIFKLRNQLGYFVFATTEEITEESLPKEPVEFKDDLTLDERFNKVLYAYHMAKTNDGKSFHKFKREVYERMIELYKEKLSEIK